MSITTKLARHYNNCCEQVMPVPVIMVKLMCYRRPMPLYPPVYPPYPQPVYQPVQQQHYPQPQQHYRPHYPHYQQPVYQQPAYQQEQRQNYQMVVYQSHQNLIENHVKPLQLQSEVQTQSNSNKNDSDSNYHLPPSYPIIEYSSDIIVLPGNIVITTLDTIPDGYFLCDGSDVSRETDSALFEAIGTFYGNGDGSTTFCLPDLEDEDHSHHYIIKR